jgi:hypothetical protein
MNKPTDKQLMERVLHRLETDSKGSVTASTKQLYHATNQIIDQVRQLNSALSIPNSQQKSLVRAKR